MLLSITQDRMKTETLINQIFEDVLAPVVQDREGNSYPLKDYVCPRDGEYLQSLIREFKLRRGLEIGLGHGISALYITEALLQNEIEPTHLIIDPHQREDYKNIGLINLQRTDAFRIVEFISDKSEFVLPSLLREGETFDFIFIDGWHGFEACFLDFIYSRKLLKVGGVLVFDDCDFAPVRKVIDYVDQDPRLKRIGSLKYETNPPGERIISYQKIAEKDLRWEWLPEF